MKRFLLSILMTLGIAHSLFTAPEKSTGTVEPTVKEDVNSFFDLMNHFHLTLTKESDGPDKDGPAEFGFVDNFDTSTEFHANFFLKYKPGALPSHDPVITPAASVEGHISSADNKASDAWRFRAGVELDIALDHNLRQWNPLHHRWIPTGTAENSLYVSLNGKYEASRDFNITKTMAELEVSPTIRAWYIGKTAYHSYLNKHANEFSVDDGMSSGVELKEWPIDFRWRPFLDIDAGATTDDGTTTAVVGMQPVEMNTTILRIRPRVHTEVWLNFIKNAMKMDSVTAFADYQFAYLPLEPSRRTHGYFQTGMNFGFTSNVGFSLTYTIGEQSPEFKHEHLLTGSLTVGF
jgi:hypothetical protein